MAESRPNIILITTDQQRGDCLGIDENAPACLQTPHLDAMAARGMRFRRGYSECPSCFPARRSLLSGMAPAAQGMVGMAGSPWSPPHTLPGELSKAGYHTFLVGKLHLQPKGKRFGYDHQVLSDAPFDEDDEYGRWLKQQPGRTEQDFGFWHGKDANGWTSGPTHFPMEQTHTYFCVSKALEFLKYQRDPSAPFFLNLSIFDPHPPIAPPREYYDRYINRELPEPAVGDWVKPWDKPLKGHRTEAWRLKLDPYSMQCLRAGYYATVNFVDDQIGRLILSMRRMGLMKNTWFVFTSDHGEMLGDHNMFRKTFAYEASARVPFIVFSESMKAPATQRVSDCPVGLQDVMPTILDIAGVEVPKACTGKSLMPIVRGEAEAVREVLHGEHAGQYDYADGMHYLVDSRYKYIWHSQHDMEQLFDLKNDPNELKDLTRTKKGKGMLKPWRERLIEILKDRPEGFVKDGKLALGAPHQCLMPGLQGDRFYSFT